MRWSTNIPDIPANCDEHRPQRITRLRNQTLRQPGDYHTPVASLKDFGTPLTYHAMLRSNQRALSPEQITYVLMYGTPIFRAGALFYVLRRRDIEPDGLRSDDIAKLIGTVVLESEGVITTVYRSTQALRHVRKKQKYYRGNIT